MAARKFVTRLEHALLYTCYNKNANTMQLKLQYKRLTTLKENSLLSRFYIIKLPLLLPLSVNYYRLLCYLSSDRLLLLYRLFL